jgi:hypothetical protein
VLLVGPPPAAQLPREADDGRRRRLEVPGEALRVAAYTAAGVVVVVVVVLPGRGRVVALEEALGVCVLLEGVVAVVHAADVHPGYVVADAQPRGVRRFAAEVALGRHERERERLVVVVVVGGDEVVVGRFVGVLARF